MANGTKNYPGNIEERGGSYRVRLCVEGEYHYYTKSEMTREEVEAFARSEYDQLKRKARVGLPGPMPFSELLDRYKEAKLPTLAPNTRATYGYSLTAFETYFVDQGGDPKAHDVRPGHVEGFLHWRRTHSPDGSKRKKPLSARSLAKDRATLHAVFTFGETLEVVQANPVAKTDPPKGDGREPIILDADQYEALLKACKDRPMLRLYVLVLGETGVRCESEALWLRWEDVDLGRGLLTVESVRKGRRTKSGKSRRVPMTKRLREALRDHMARYRFKTYHGERTRWIFHHLTDRRRAKAGQRIGSLRRGFEAAVERAELPADLNQHDLRHRRVTTWLQEGHPAHIVQKAMGHSDLRTTMGYEHLVDDDLMGLVEAPEEELRELANG